MTQSASLPPKVQNFVQFAVERGLTTDADVRSHIHAGLRSMPTTKTYKRWNEKKLAELQEKCESARQLYREALASGVVMAPAALTLEQKATGHPDNASTQAALRLLAKRTAPKPAT